MGSPCAPSAFACRNHGPNGLAEAHGTRVHGRRDEESRILRRVLQARGRRAYLPNQQVASALSLLARPASAAAGFSASAIDPCLVPIRAPFAEPASDVSSIGKLVTNRSNSSSLI